VETNDLFLRVTQAIAASDGRVTLQTILDWIFNAESRPLVQPTAGSGSSSAENVPPASQVASQATAALSDWDDTIKVEDFGPGLIEPTVLMLNLFKKYRSADPPSIVDIKGSGIYDITFKSKVISLYNISILHRQWRHFGGKNCKLYPYGLY